MRYNTAYTAQLYCQFFTEMYFVSVDISVQETYTFYMTIAETVLSKESKDPGTCHLIFLDSDLKRQQADFSLATEMTNVEMNFYLFFCCCFWIFAFITCWKAGAAIVSLENETAQRKILLASLNHAFFVGWLPGLENVHKAAQDMILCNLLI